MKSSLYVSICLAGAVLAGCGSAAQVGAPADLSSSSAAGRAGSWMMPAAQSQNLLYVSDVGKNAVFVYTYPKGSLVGTLTGFYSPVRVCSDSSGNVFVTNTNARQILKYAHGGKTPLTTYADSKYLPVDCSIDPTSGTLAVTNYGPSGSNTGSVALYKDGKGSAKILQASGIQAYLFCGYNNSGDLFVVGLKNYNYDYAMLELPKGSTKFETIALDQKFFSWGGVKWDGKYLAVSDGASAIYDFAVKGKKGTEARTVQLARAINVVQFWIDGTTVVAPDGPNGGNHDVGLWSYPNGGKPTRVIGKADLENPSGATVSLVK